MVLVDGPEEPVACFGVEGGPCEPLGTSEAKSASASALDIFVLTLGTTVR